MTWYRLALLPVAAAAVVGAVLFGLVGWVACLDVDVDI